MKIKCPACGVENYFTDLEDEETRFCSNCNEPLFKSRKEKPISEFSNSFGDRLSQLINYGIFEIYGELSKEFTYRFPNLSRKDISAMTASLTNELFMSSQKGPALSFKQANMELLSREVNNVLKNKERVKNIVLTLRIKGIKLLSEESEYGLKLLERAEEIDPHGRVPNGKEIEKLLSEMDL
ncbi:hypothetical protein ES702_01384 [subsurface metagenome]